MQDNLTLNDKPASSNGMRPPPARTHTGERLPPPYSAVVPNRRENLPPRTNPNHRPSHSQEDEKRAIRPAASGSSRAGPSSRSRPPAGLDIFADPVEESTPKKSRPRRNSESSVLERSGKLLDPEDEKRRQERRRRERRHHERSKDGKSKKPDRKLDIIDKLDVTSIYGTGRKYHLGGRWTTR
jgi:hypothetical protein